MKIAFILIIFILIIWRVKKGFDNGMVKEIVNILSALVSCVSIVLLFFVISSVRAKTFSVLTLSMLALIGIGFVYKLCNLIFKPITAITNLSLINSLDKCLGAVFGFLEAIIFMCFLYLLLKYTGVLII